MDLETKQMIFDRLGNDWPRFVESRYNLKLKKISSRDYVILCPFHKENTPSGHIYLPNKKYNYPHYKCFGCGTFKNAIDFVMSMENLEFIEACKVLGGYVNVEITTAPKNQKHEEYKDLMCQHTRRYQRELQNHQEFLKYLKIERQLTDKSITQFCLGAVPHNEFQYRNDTGNISDRIAFPIFEHKLINETKVLGMGYRTLKDKLPDWDKAKDPKYRNDATTTGELEGVFKKENCLYGYPFAVQAIRNNYAIVVEGYMDVISLHQANIINTVGTMGTAFTENQMDALRKETSNIVLFLDSDESGN